MTNYSPIYSPIQGHFIRPNHWYGHAQFCIDVPIAYDICTVPAGFRTDGLSLSRWLVVVGILLMISATYYVSSIVFVLGGLCCLSVVFFPRWGNTLRACILHDYLLAQPNLSWHWANKQFLRYLKLTHIALWRCYTLFIAVTVYQAVKHLYQRLIQPRGNS